MTPAERFYKYFNRAYGHPEDDIPSQLKNEFIEEFISQIPEVIDELETNLLKHEIHKFYVQIKNLKYLCEYSEEFNRYWLLLRSISGGLDRVLEDPTTDHIADVYIYYFSRYGGRRKLRDENWFEGHRWEFLDRLSNIPTNDDLNDFILEKIDDLSNYFQLYKKELTSFILELKELTN
ncbi:hypothetical protein [Sunxiuqinia sp. sy24]|uniref:hypothetical protein n=1 Tax=Sunxiuqinia sp. sy24 TaxID=3461495 RepID=UPI0040468252